MAAATTSVCAANHLIARLRHNLPLHALARLVSGARNLVEGLVEGKVVPDGILLACQHGGLWPGHFGITFPYLPASGGLMPVVGIVCGYEVVDTVQVQFPFCSVHDGLGDHLSVAELGLDVPVVVDAEVHVVGI